MSSPTHPPEIRPWRDPTATLTRQMATKFTEADAERVLAYLASLPENVTISDFLRALALDHLAAIDAADEQAAAEAAAERKRRRSRRA